MNYNTLTTLIQSTTQNYETTFVATIDQFIQRAERRIHMEANLPSSRKNSTGATIVGTRTILLPTDYITGKAIEVVTASGVVNLLPKAAEYLTEMYPVTTTQAQPKFYAQYDMNNILVAPTPDQIYVVNFHYFAMPPSITTAGTTWLGNNFEQVLFYGALLEAYVFMKGDADVMTYYKTGFDAGIAELKAVVAQTKMHNFR